MSPIIGPSCLFSLQSENTCYHGHLEVVDKSKKIERQGGLKNVGHRSPSSSCQVNKAEQKGCQLISIQPCAIFKCDITLYVVYEETECLV